MQEDIEAQNMEQQGVSNANMDGNIEIHSRKVAEDIVTLTMSNQESSGVLYNADSKYGSAAIERQMLEQATMIRDWAARNGLEEGEDYQIINSYEDIIRSAGGDVVPHEVKAFYMIIHEQHYKKFSEFFLTEYAESMSQICSKRETSLNYSWGGRFLVDSSGVPCDTVAASDVKNLVVPTRHTEFTEFFKQRAGVDFPSAELLNTVLHDMAKAGLKSYEEALCILNDQKRHGTLPDDGYGLIDSTIHAIELLRRALSGIAVQELPEQLQGAMPIEMRTYADLTYNAEDIADFSRVEQITGIRIPANARVDRVCDHFGFNRNEVDDICCDFSRELQRRNVFQ